MLFDKLMDRVAGRFGRVETRRTARKMLSGLVSELPAKNCWTLAEAAGDETPDAMQHFLARAVWDEDAVCDDLRGYVVEHLGAVEVILVVDESGDLKKGTGTVGVQRQYTGTAGRIENSQVAVYLGYATAAGHAFLDSELYLPKSWTDDPNRCAEAGVPGDVEFATKPALAKKMSVRALDAGVGAHGVSGDEVYGADPALRGELETRGVGYVLAVSCDRRVNTPTGRYRADELAKRVPRRGWQPHSAGDGAKGPRLYDWAWIGIDPDADNAPTGHRWLLIRRHHRSGELAYYRCYAATSAPLNKLVAVAGRRWSIEENFQTGKGLTGLDQHQVRRWKSWRRWTILAMLAHAFLTALAITERAITTPTDTRPPDTDQLIPLTRNEIRHLFATLVMNSTRDIWHRTTWSTWRRRHQYRAKTSHYQRRSASTP